LADYTINMFGFDFRQGRVCAIPLGQRLAEILGRASFHRGLGNPAPTPPTNVVGHLVLSNSAVTTTMQTTQMMPDAITGKICDTTGGRRGKVPLDSGRLGEGKCRQHTSSFTWPTPTSDWK
jgi:hypothetical protein